MATQFIGVSFEFNCWIDGRAWFLVDYESSMNRPFSSCRAQMICRRWWGICCCLGSVISVVAGTKVLPVLNQPIADRDGVAGLPLVVELSTHFGTEPIDDQVVRFTSRFLLDGTPLVMDMALFSNRTPVTRQNFLSYVTSGAYENSFIHRSVPGFVIQGGALRVEGNAIVPIPTSPPIVNEFGISNTLGTISMAKLGGDPNSATSQWFVSLGANSDILDTQNSGFTVFGRMTLDSFESAQIFGNRVNFPIYDYRQQFNNGSLGELPLFFSHVPPSVQPDQLILFTNVSLVPLPAEQAGEVTALSYSVVVNSHPALVSTSIDSQGRLTVTPLTNGIGRVTLMVRGTDSVGNIVDDTFVLNLNDSYATWASKNSFAGGQSAAVQNPDGDEWSNLQEFAFLGNPALPSLAGAAIFPGFSGSAAASRFLTVTFPVRKFTEGLVYVVEGNNGLVGGWTEIWRSSEGFFHPRVVGAVDQVDRTVLTVRDAVAQQAAPKRFLRVRVETL